MQRKMNHAQQSIQQNKKPFTRNSKRHGQQKLRTTRQPQKPGAPKSDVKPLCKECNRRHNDMCLWFLGKCFKCGKQGNFALNCPMLQAPVTGRAYVIHAEEAEPETTLITGRICLEGVATNALLDSGATHSFFSQSFASHLKVSPKQLRLGFRVIVPSGEEMLSCSVVRDVELEMQGHLVRADLIVLLMPEFDIILDIDWLAANGASINFRRRTGFQAFLASVVSIRDTASQTIEEVEVIKEFPDVFPNDVIGVPQKREVEFSIELMAGTVPISKIPYRLAPTEMKELKNQI
ncbi:uncharacterized protein LOC142554637 [Primulina tabacum]|uniref:uncharacterized protein LOC142554637 n=1 Tax=Primulina tabacum TaxID=48773 RepID=UPI003F5AC8D3